MAKNLHPNEEENLNFQQNKGKTEKKLNAEKIEELEFEDIAKTTPDSKKDPKGTAFAWTEEYEQKLKEVEGKIGVMKENLRNINSELSQLENNKFQSNDAEKIESDGITETRTYSTDFIKNPIKEILKSNPDIKNIYYINTEATGDKLHVNIGMGTNTARGMIEIVLGNKEDTIEIESMDFKSNFIKKLWMAIFIKPNLEKIFSNLKEEISFREKYQIDTIHIKDGKIEVSSKKVNLPNEHQVWITQKESLENKKIIAEKTLSELEKNADALIIKKEGKNQKIKPIELSDTEFLFKKIEFKIRNISPEYLVSLREKGDKLFKNNSKSWKLVKEFLNDLSIQEKTINNEEKLIQKEVTGKGKFIESIAIFKDWAENSTKENLRKAGIENLETLKKLFAIGDKKETIVESPKKQKAVTVIKEREVSREEVQPREEEPINERHRLSLFEIEKIESINPKKISYLGYYIPPTVDIKEKNIGDLRKEPILFRKLKKIKGNSIEEVERLLKNEYDQEGATEVKDGAHIQVREIPDKKESSLSKNTPTTVETPEVIDEKDLEDVEITEEKKKEIEEEIKKILKTGIFDYRTILLDQEKEGISIEIKNKELSITIDIKEKLTDNTTSVVIPMVKKKGEFINLKSRYAKKGSRGLKVMLDQSFNELGGHLVKILNK